MTNSEKGKVQIPGEYFLKMAKADYSDYRSALPREFYQNSADAGANIIEVTAGNGTSGRIDIYDDGCGMTKEILQNKLLVLGGSHKAEGSTGAFGKAKELLFFSWVKYEIRTNGILVTGQGADYEIGEDSEPQKPGTLCSIWIGEEDRVSNMMQYFESVARRMEISTKIFVNGDSIPCECRKGELVKTFDWGKLYHDTNKEASNMFIRINGTWMFNRWIGDKVGTLVLELSKHSLECMTSNRDSLNYKYANELDEFIKQLSADRMSALEPEKEVVRARILGDGEVVLAEDEEEELGELDIEAMKKVVSGEVDIEDSHFKGNVKDVILGLAKHAAKNGGDLETTINRMESVVKESDTPDSGEIMEMVNLLLEDWSDKINFIGYAPDFEIEFEEGNRRPVDKYMKTKWANTIAKMWTEVVKQVMLDNDIFQNFTAGFTFRENREASIEDGDKTVIFLNPNKIGKIGGWSKKPLSNRRDLMEELKDLAIHEIAHLEYKYHDEFFVNEMHRLRIHTRKSDAAYLKISKIKAA